MPPSPASPSGPAPAYNSPIPAPARLCGRRGAPALLERGLRGAPPPRAPLLPPRRRPPRKQRRPSPSAPPPPGPLRWGWTLRVPRGPRGDEGRGGSLAWRRFKYRAGGGEVWGSENKGGQRDVSDGETARRRGAAEQMRKRRDRGHKRGRLRSPPPARGARTPPRAIPGAHVCRATPVVPVHPGAPQGAPAFVQTLAGEGAQAREAEQRAPESARRAPAPRLAAPGLPARRALCSRPGPGPEGAAWCQGARRRGRRATYVSLCSRARRSLGTLRRWDSLLRSPSTVSSWGTDRS